MNIYQNIPNNKNGHFKRRDSLQIISKKCINAFASPHFYGNYLKEIIDDIYQKIGKKFLVNLPRQNVLNAYKKVAHQAVLRISDSQINEIIQCVLDSQQ